ncbi:MAG TPA: ABC transporter substrate-binding protein [Xanthobacteraceae bacterium]|nr:ABC transporter substrate-binding protein [Xanthobacteraceae bacterium]
MRSLRNPVLRRDFLAAVAGAAIWPHVARAQQPRIPMIGYLDAGSLAESRQENAVAFNQGLAETGYVPGRNVAFEYREAKGNLELLPELARDLVRREVDVIMAPGSGVAALAAKAVTTTIPIVFSNAGDPVRSGLVASLSHPGGNITGVADFGIALSAKRLELTKLLIPSASRVGILAPLIQPQAAAHDIATAQEGARSLGIDLILLRVSSPDEIDTAFATLARQRVDALCLVTNLLFFSNRQRVIGLAAQHRLPTVYPFIQYAESGGLMSYGSSLTARAHQAGVYVGLILNGQKPGDLPIRRLTTFELAINMTTAKALGLAVPASFLALADRVIG